MMSIGLIVSLAIFAIYVIYVTGWMIWCVRFKIKYGKDIGAAAYVAITCVSLFALLAWLVSICVM